MKKNDIILLILSWIRKLYNFVGSRIDKQWEERCNDPSLAALSITLYQELLKSYLRENPTLDELATVYRAHYKGRKFITNLPAPAILWGCTVAEFILNDENFNAYTLVGIINHFLEETGTYYRAFTLKEFEDIKEELPNLEIRRNKSEIQPVKFELISNMN